MEVLFTVDRVVLELDVVVPEQKKTVEVSVAVMVGHCSRVWLVVVE